MKIKIKRIKSSEKANQVREMKGRTEGAGAGGRGWQCHLAAAAVPNSA